MAFRSFVSCIAGLVISVAGFGAPGDPLDAKAIVPTPKHYSALEPYRRHADTTPLPWRQANDTVERIGGWRSYAREAAASSPAAAAKGAPAAPEAPASAPPPARTAPGAGHKH